MADEATVIDASPAGTTPEPEHAPAPEVITDNEEIILGAIQKGYEKAEKEGIDFEEIDAMTPDELERFTSEITTLAQQAEPVTQKSEGQPAAPPVPAEFVALKSEHENLKSVLGRQALEIGQVRQRNAELGQFQPFHDLMQNDPEFNRYVLNYGKPGAAQQITPALDIPEGYDPYNPAHITQLVEQGVSKKLQAERMAAVENNRKAQEQNIQRTFQTNVFAKSQEAIARGVDPVRVQMAVQKIVAKVFTGDFVDLALKLENFDSEIAKAEQRGAEKAKSETAKQIQAAAQIPVRTAGAGSQQSSKTVNTNPKSHTECETPEQLYNYCKRLEPGSDRWEAAAKYGENQGWPGF